MENTGQNYVRSYRFSFGRAIFAGFLATLLIEILMYIQGQNSALTLGKMVLGSEATTTYIYLAGAAFCLLVGIIFALFYALILAPMKFMSDFITGIIFAGIMTALAVYTSPKLPQIVEKVMKKQSEVALMQTEEKSTEVAKTEDLVQSDIKKDEKHELLNSFMIHLIFAYAVIVIYRQCRIVRTETKR